MTEHDDGTMPPPAPRTIPRSVDHAGSALVVIGLVGLAAWVWRLVRGQFVDAPDSLGERLDLVADQMPLLLLAGLVGGIGVGLRTMAGRSAGVEARPVIGGPVLPLLLGVAAVLALVVAGAALTADDDPSLDITAAWEDIRLLERDPPGAPAVIAESEPTHTLTVHSDGCGVFRTGEIGEDLTWVITDAAGFQVLGRNAAGETQYRYFQPGTYTVVLEQFGPGYYVEVSNTVTITC